MVVCLRFKNSWTARPVHKLAVTRTIQPITPDEEELYGFPERRNFMRTAMLINGVMYVSLIGVLAMAWGWLHRS